MNENAIPDLLGIALFMTPLMAYILHADPLWYLVGFGIFLYAFVIVAGSRASREGTPP